ncbi:unnamed protein product [Prorocentrum cordatum]|uniref:Calmodulin n=1 Tax=Prorocentrum cordatum TaxID=2364126 RepID=A0ABN9QBS3_9DINO|nr:unnamed protein product [Polarella glacialis]
MLALGGISVYSILRNRAVGVDALSALGYELLDEGLADGTETPGAEKVTALEFAPSEGPEAGRLAGAEASGPPAGGAPGVQPSVVGLPLEGRAGGGHAPRRARASRDEEELELEVRAALGIGSGVWAGAAWTAGAGQAAGLPRGGCEEAGAAGAKGAASVEALAATAEDRGGRGKDEACPHLVEPHGAENGREEAGREAAGEVERGVLDEAEAGAREEDEAARAREEAARRAQEEAEARAREEAARRAREEAEARAREEAEARAREEAEAKAAEARAREEADAKARGEAARRAQEEAEATARREAKSVYQTQWLAPPSTDEYRAEFAQLGPSTAGKVSGQQAKPKLVESKLPSSILREVWALADADKDGMLTLYEYALAMHFIKMKLNGQDLPAALPEKMHPSSVEAMVTDETRATEEAGARVREEAQRRKREEAEVRAKEEAEARAKEEAERAREEAERRAREEAEARAKEENERRVQEEAEARAREARAKEEAEARAKEEAEAERRRREEAGPGAAAEDAAAAESAAECGWLSLEAPAEPPAGGAAAAGAAPSASSSGLGKVGKQLDRMSSQIVKMSDKMDLDKISGRVDKLGAKGADKMKSWMRAAGAGSVGREAEPEQSPATESSSSGSAAKLPGFGRSKISFSAMKKGTAKLAKNVQSAIATDFTDMPDRHAPRTNSADGFQLDAALASSEEAQSSVGADPGVPPGEAAQLPDGAGSFQLDAALEMQPSSNVETVDLLG